MSTLNINISRLKLIGSAQISAIRQFPNKLNPAHDEGFEDGIRHILELAEDFAQAEVPPMDEVVALLDGFTVRGHKNA